MNRTTPIDAYLSDIEEIYVSNGWGERYPPDLLRKMYSSCFYLLATDGRNVVGLLRAFSDHFTVTHLSEVVIQKGEQGKGIGRILVSALVKDLGHTAIYADALGDRSSNFFGKLADAGFIKKTQFTVYARRAAPRA